jgi:hypothetical protein
MYLPKAGFVVVGVCAKFILSAAAETLHYQNKS